MDDIDRYIKKITYNAWVESNTQATVNFKDLMIPVSKPTDNMSNENIENRNYVTEFVSKCGSQSDFSDISVLSFSSDEEITNPREDGNIPIKRTDKQTDMLAVDHRLPKCFMFENKSCQVGGELNAPLDLSQSTLTDVSELSGSASSLSPAKRSSQAYSLNHPAITALEKKLAAIQSETRHSRTGCRDKNHRQLIKLVQQIGSHLTEELENAYNCGLSQSENNMLYICRHNEALEENLRLLYQERNELMDIVEKPTWDTMYGYTGRLQRELQLLREKLTVCAEQQFHEKDSSLGSMVTADLIKASQDNNKALAATFERNDKINQLKLTLFRQQDYIMELERRLALAESLLPTHLKLSENGTSENGTSEECSRSTMVDIINCDCADYTPLTSLRPDLSAADVFRIGGGSRCFDDDHEEEIKCTFSPQRQLNYFRKKKEKLSQIIT